MSSGSPQSRPRRRNLMGMLWQKWQARKDEPIRPDRSLVTPTVSACGLPPYPLDMSPKLSLSQGLFDIQGIPYASLSAGLPDRYHPTDIAQYALACWNEYLATGSELHKRSFMAQAGWLVAHESHTTPGAGGWPIQVLEESWHTPHAHLSALTQGNAISVLMRAYLLSSEESFLRAARRAVRTFELDILDGGVRGPVGDGGEFFEEVAIYPAEHMLHGHLVGLVSLYDWMAIARGGQSAELVERGHAALHAALDVFDTGYWSCIDLHRRRVASRTQHVLHARLLGVLAALANCAECRARAARWARYEQSLTHRVRSTMARQGARFYRALYGPVQRLLFPSARGETNHGPAQICVPITAFPVAGGMREVVAGIAQVMSGEWRIEYLTRHRGQGARDLTIQQFGGKVTSPGRFPTVWLYALAGYLKLVHLLRTPRNYCLILPQDGVFTAAFAALAGRMAGVRVVSIDHGNIPVLFSPAYQAERMRAYAAHPLPLRLLRQLELWWYLTSQRVLARIATRYTDHFLPAGDDVAEAYIHHLGVATNRISRFPFMVDVERFAPVDNARRAHLREEHGVNSDAIVITMINRLAPEKGIDIAIDGVSQALSKLTPAARSRIHMIIAGDGPQRAQIAAMIRQFGLGEMCHLWGEASREGVAELLSISDIFLYTGTRGINSMAVLEAMAAGCGVIASSAPRMIATYLAEGRGIAVPAGDARAVGTALARAANDLPLCREMGRLARDYVAAHHTAMALKRSLLRATFWTPQYADLLSDPNGDNNRRGRGECQTRAEGLIHVG